jgi:hypothetical protein
VHFELRVDDASPGKPESRTKLDVNPVNNRPLFLNSPVARVYRNAVVLNDVSRDLGGGILKYFGAQENTWYSERQTISPEREKR